MNKLFTAIAVAVSLSVGTFTVLADEHAKNQAKSEKQAKSAITFRQSLLQLIRSNMGPLGGMAKGHIPMDTAVIATNSERIEFLASMMHDYFELNTTAYSLETAAKNNIWKNHEDFSQKIDALVSAAADLNALAKANKEDDFRKGIGAVGAACKACHDDYKAD